MAFSHIPLRRTIPAGVLAFLAQYAPAFAPADAVRPPVSSGADATDGSSELVSAGGRVSAANEEVGEA